mmetsp:Transcript_98909/g.317114  ORF Transcript_98909/g.317114 Transcript_98909/m.317114 type:complete len:223 (+) Transcript_98909:1165-1833(+)
MASVVVALAVGVVLAVDAMAVALALVVAVTAAVVGSRCGGGGARCRRLGLVLRGGLTRNWLLPDVLPHLFLDLVQEDGDVSVITLAVQLPEPFVQASQPAEQLALHPWHSFALDPNLDPRATDVERHVLGPGLGRNLDPELHHLGSLSPAVVEALSELGVLQHEGDLRQDVEWADLAEDCLDHLCSWIQSANNLIGRAQLLFGCQVGLVQKDDICLLHLLRE